MEQERQRIEAQVLERAAKDPQFRTQLQQDPRGTISRDFGVQVPQDITVEVLDETPSKVYLVLPAAPAQRGQELSGQDLQAVAGGWSGVSDCSPTCAGNMNSCTCTCPGHGC